MTLHHGVNIYLKQVKHDSNVAKWALWISTWTWGAPVYRQNIKLRESYSLTVCPLDTFWVPPHWRLHWRAWSWSVRWDKPWTAHTYIGPALLLRTQKFSETQLREEKRPNVCQTFGKMGNNNDRKCKKCTYIPHFVAEIWLKYAKDFKARLEKCCRK